MVRYLIPPAFFFFAYFAGGLLIVPLGIGALILFLLKRTETGIVIACFAFATGGHLIALRDTLPTTETVEVVFADSEILRLENGMTLRHDGTMVPKEGDEIRFLDPAIVRGQGAPHLTAFEIVPERSLRMRLSDFVRERSDSTMLLAFATGKRLFSPAERASFLKTGTMHVVAISAFHIGLLFILLHFIGRLLALLRTVPPRTILVLTVMLKALVLFWYLSLTGWATPTLRAALFVMLFDLFLTIGITAHSFQIFLLSLALTAALIPKSMTSWSFIMSALSVFAVITLWNRLPRSSLISITALSLIINLLLIPVSAELSGFVPLLAPLANLVTIPLAGLLVALLIPVQILFPFFPAIAGILLLPADAVARVTTEDLRYLAALSDATLIPLRQAGTGWALLFYTAAGTVLLASGRVRRAALIVLFLSVIPYFVMPTPDRGIERIYGLPGEAYCVREGYGTGRIVETTRYNFPADYVQRKLDTLSTALERDLSRCGITRLTALHLRGPIPSRTLTELRKRPRFEGTALHLIPPVAPGAPPDDQSF
ncbi:MAG TPA: ComEC/Rec2 family competence protein [bacterium]|nr:ComEC/Rec2 family competence protein [bacterium]